VPEESFVKVRLYEFAGDDSMRVKLTGIISQIHAKSRDQGFKKPFSLTALLNILGDEGIPLDEEQFREMVKEAPLKNLISNIKGNKVVFKGDSDTSDSELEEPGADTKVLDKMAKRAADKRD
jgi:hypothetical protein